MRRALTWYILLICILSVLGCDLYIAGNKEMGYRIEVQAAYIKYDDLYVIENALTQRGYEILFAEREVQGRGIPRYPGEVYSLFRKTVKDAHDEPVDVFVSYVKDQSNNQMVHVLITVQNWFRGGILPVVRDEIDGIERLTHKELINRVGEEHVTVKRFGRTHEGR
jgi:hypothetical protein